jgi:hypothetical protein
VTEERPTLAAQLRALADLLDEHPQLAPPLQTVTLNHYGSVLDGGDAEMAALARGTGRWEKVELADWLILRREVGPDVMIDLNFRREAVCERVQVGTRPVEKPDPEALAAVPTVTVEEPVYEWTCGPVLALAGKEEPCPTTS